MPCTVTETRTQPILKRCGDWSVSVVRMSIPGRSLPVYELGPWIGQADPYLLGYVVRVAATIKAAAAPVFPWTLGAAATIDARLYLGRAMLETAVLTLGAATYADAPAVAAALQSAFAGATPYLSTTTVSNDVFGRLICTPPAGSTLQISGRLPADQLKCGFTALNGQNTTPGAVQAQNSCNLLAPTQSTYTAQADARLIWVPEDQSAPVAAPPLLQADFNTNFYWGWSLAHGAALWSTAYADAQSQCYSLILAQFPSFKGFTSKPATITFDPSTQLFSFNADPWSVASTSGPAQSVGGLYPLAEESFTFSMDESSDNLLGNWNSFTPAGSIGTPAYSQLVFATAKLDIAANRVVLTQDGSSLSTGWSPVTSILCTSNDLQVLGEQLSAPAVILGNVPQSESVASTFAPILAEISYLGQSCLVWNETNIFEPYVLRRVQLQGSQPLTTVSMALLWRDVFGTVRDVKLPSSGGVFTVKLEFLKNDSVD